MDYGIPAVRSESRAVGNEIERIRRYHESGRLYTIGRRTAA